MLFQLSLTDVAYALLIRVVQKTAPNLVSAGFSTGLLGGRRSGETILVSPGSDIQQ